MFPRIVPKTLIKIHKNKPVFGKKVIGKIFWKDHNPSTGHLCFEVPTNDITQRSFAELFTHERLIEPKGSILIEDKTILGLEGKQRILIHSNPVTDIHETYIIETIYGNLIFKNIDEFNAFTDRITQQILLNNSEFNLRLFNSIYEHIQQNWISCSDLQPELTTNLNWRNDLEIYYYINNRILKQALSKKLSNVQILQYETEVFSDINSLNTEFDNIPEIKEVITDIIDLNL